MSAKYYYTTYKVKISRDPPFQRKVLQMTSSQMAQEIRLILNDLNLLKRWRVAALRFCYFIKQETKEQLSDLFAKNIGCSKESLQSNGGLKKFQSVE